jgi:hypothetical protein
VQGAIAATTHELVGVELTTGSYREIASELTSRAIAARRRLECQVGHARDEAVRDYRYRAVSKRKEAPKGGLEVPHNQILRFCSAI